MIKMLKELKRIQKGLDKNAKAQRKLNLDMSETTIVADWEYQTRRHDDLVVEEERLNEELRVLIHGGGTGES